jgi:hypothetical protein
LSDDHSTGEVDERSIAKKFGVRELTYPDSEHFKALSRFLDGAIDTSRCGPVPKTAIVILLEFLQGIVNRQHITKGPRMAQEEFDLLQSPYYLAARIVTKLIRERKIEVEQKGKTYQTTYNALGQFIELLRNLLDPGCYWLRLRTVPEGILESMVLLREFIRVYPEQRKKGRAM